METKRHIIQKHSIEVTFASDQNPFGIKERLSAFCVTVLLHELENLFDGKTAHRFFRADEIIIDAGELPADGWESALIDRVVAHLSQRIDDAVLNARESRSISSQVVITSGMDTGTQNNFQVVDKQENLFNAVFYFLQYGRLPWYTGVENQTSLHDGLLLITSQPPWFSKLIDLIKSDPATFDRLLYQTNENVVLSMVIRSGLETDMVINLRNFLTEILNRLKVASGLAITEDGTRYVVCSILLRAALDSKAETQKIPWDNYFSNVIQLIIKKFSGNGINRLLTVISESAFENFREKAQACIEQHAHESDDATIKEKSTATLPSNKKRNVTDLTEDGLFISNAGLVLLHPFLPMLFENTGYIYNKTWTSEEHKQRALVLTQFMVTGKDEFPEFDLALNKILMGYPMEETLPAEIQLSKFEKHEATDVLRSVIRHWTALKNTSIEGLQSSFLKREGKLLLTESGWRLQVEHRTMDILVNKLPWSFSIVKTPWMDMKLYVDWNN